MRTRTFELWDGALGDEAARNARELNAKRLRETVMRDKGSLLLYFAGYKIAPRRDAAFLLIVRFLGIAFLSPNRREIRLLVRLESTHPNRSFPGKSLRSPCHPDRSSAGAQWRDLQFSPATDLQEVDVRPARQITQRNERAFGLHPLAIAGWVDTNSKCNKNRWVAQVSLLRPGFLWAMDPNREERAFALYPLHQCRVPHISLVFREMWDTAALALKPLAGLTALQGCPMFAPALPGFPTTHC